MKNIRKIGLIGSGNVATHLAGALCSAGYEIGWVYSKTPRNARSLAKAIGSESTARPQDRLGEIDMVLISVKDDAVEDVVKTLGLCNIPLVHTSASLPLDILLKASQRAGVLYPLQTFTKGRKVNMAEVPFFIESSDAGLRKALEAMGKKIGGKTFYAGHSERLCLHIAGVFTCNFPNYLFSIADEIVRKCGFQFEILHPLLKETAAKATGAPPRTVQTGPAIRGDKKIIQKHKEWLKDDAAAKEIYSVLSKNLLVEKSKKNTGQ
jgi:predicted short-subunit dehydrogenase-like oxidoreductase (DUF2520 family)